MRTVHRSLLLGSLFLGACSDPLPVVPIGPQVLASIDGATAPSASPGQTIELEGVGAAVTKVRFVESGGTPIDVAPLGVSSFGGSLTVVVPSTLAVPGTASVSVLATGSVNPSNALTLSIVAAPTLNPSGITWTSSGTTPLPAPRRAHAAVAVPVNSTQAWLYVIGGNDGTNDLASVLVAPLDASGDVGAWQTTSPLPSTLALFAVAEADPSNSPVPAGSAFVYVIGGQVNGGDQPGGTTGAFVGNVSLASGAISWSTTASPLFSNVPVVGLRATHHRGYVYVTGGFAGPVTGATQITPLGDAFGTTFVAQVLASGQLSSLTGTMNPQPLPVPVGLHETFASNGFLYVVGGDVGPETAPYGVASTKATQQVWSAPVSQGTVGSWTAVSLTLRAREKFSSFAVAGNVLLFEGAYGATDLEGESAALGPSGSTAVFVAEPATARPNLTVFDGAGVVSPLVDASNQPHLLLVGGDSVASPGSLSTAVLRTGP